MLAGKLLLGSNHLPRLLVPGIETLNKGGDLYREDGANSAEVKTNLISLFWGFVGQSLVVSGLEGPKGREIGWKVPSRPI